MKSRWERKWPTHYQEAAKVEKNKEKIPNLVNSDRELILPILKIIVFMLEN